MELAVLVAEALLAGAEGTEVLDGLGDDVVVELEVDAAGASWIRTVSDCGVSVEDMESMRDGTYERRSCPCW